MGRHYFLSNPGYLWSVEPEPFITTQSLAGYFQKSSAETIWHDFH
jgi:hypothetical protein